jgi:hypothetical protein
VKRYTAYLVFDTFVNLLKVTCFFVGSYDPKYYSRTIPDGYSFIRLALVLMDLASFTFLNLAILVEPTFIQAWRAFFNLTSSDRLNTNESNGGDDGEMALLFDKQVEGGDLIRRQTAMISDTGF